MRISRILAIVFKEFSQLSRDKMTFAMIVMIPLVQLILFGYAINTNIRNIPAIVVDQSQTEASRLLIDTVKATQVVSFKKYYMNPKRAEQEILSGQVKAILIIPDDINQRLLDHRPLAQWVVDGSDSVISATITGLKNMPFSMDYKQNNKMNDTQSQATFVNTLFYNPARKSSTNIIPGLLAIILTMTMVLFTSTAIVKEREQGNLELLITTPIQPIELMVAKIIPFIFVGLIQSIIVLGLGFSLFNVPMNGSFLQIFLGTLLFIAASLTLGLIISTIAITQLQAMQMTIFIIMPSILLSGFMFPFEGMPLVAQWIAELFPATHFIRITRGVILRGAELSDLWREILWLFGFCVVGIIIAAKRFKKSLD